MLKSVPKKKYIYIRNVTCRFFKDNSGLHQVFSLYILLLGRCHEMVRKVQMQCAGHKLVMLNARP